MKKSTLLYVSLFSLSLSGMIMSSDRLERDLEFVHKKKYTHKSNATAFFNAQKFDRDIAHAKQRDNRFQQTQQTFPIAPKKTIPGLAPKTVAKKN